MKETLSELDLYICQPKDTLTSISKMYNIEVDDILLLNPLIKNNELYPGLPLNLPKLLRSKNDTKQTYCCRCAWWKFKKCMETIYSFSPS